MAAILPSMIQRDASIASVIGGNTEHFGITIAYISFARIAKPPRFPISPCDFYSADAC
jgi:hypothetical protein